MQPDGSLLPYTTYSSPVRLFGTPVLHDGDLFGMALGTEDAKEGTSAFLEKRAAEFKGQ